MIQIQPTGIQLHSVFFGGDINHKIVVGVMEGISLEMSISPNKGLKKQTWLEAL